jgi:hypothetical protein
MRCRAFFNSCSGDWTLALPYRVVSLAPTDMLLLCAASQLCALSFFANNNLYQLFRFVESGATIAAEHLNCSPTKVPSSMTNPERNFVQIVAKRNPCRSFLRVELLSSRESSSLHRFLVFLAAELLQAKSRLFSESMHPIGSLLDPSVLAGVWLRGSPCSDCF